MCATAAGATRRRRSSSSLVSSGCRVSEVAGLRVDDIDWRDRKCKVIGKGNKERTVYFSVRAKLMLQLYIEGRKGGEALFSSSRAPYEPLSDRGIEKIISKLGKRIGMERPLYPHLMRHTFASHALNCGMELTIIQHLLGHSDPKTTLIYAKSTLLECSMNTTASLLDARK
ncbi:MAG: tyrosine-type recombinase/integrase [Butyricicoccaceae bacterium]